MLKGAARELRRCQAFTMEGWGDQCKKWSNQHSNFCNMHTPPKIVSEEDKELSNELKRLFPKLYKRSQLRCKCSAYPFPHFIGTGICCWPDPPTHRWISKSSPHFFLRAPHPEERLKSLLRASGIRSKRTSFIRWMRTGRVVPLKPEELKPHDFTLFEDYISNYVELPDWSSLPLDEKRRRIKEQMVKELEREMTAKQTYKQCLKPTPPRVSRKGIDDPSSGADSEDEADEPKFKVIRVRVRLRNGEIVEKGYMIFETGEKVPLQ